MDEPHQVMSRRQVFDLPELGLEATEHRQNAVSTGSREDVLTMGGRSAHYGPGVQALVVKLLVDPKMPLEPSGALRLSQAGAERLCDAARSLCPAADLPTRGRVDNYGAAASGPWGMGRRGLSAML